MEPGYNGKELIGKLPYWKSLSDGEKAAVSQAAAIRNYPAGCILYDGTESGAACLGMIYVLSGEIRAHIVSDEGLISVQRGKVILRDISGLEKIRE